MHNLTYKCLLGVFLCLANTLFANPLSLNQRVSYQRAIEEVFWRHTIWPKENPDPKPGLNAIISDQQIRLKVENYLRKSNAMAEYFHEPITKQNMQAEMNRIAKETKDPEVLRELFAAVQVEKSIQADAIHHRPIPGLQLRQQALHLRARTTPQFGPVHK